jgi:hypothetical protein
LHSKKSIAVATAWQFLIWGVGWSFGSVRKSSPGLSAECGNPEKNYFPPKLFSKKFLSIHWLRRVFQDFRKLAWKMLL